MKLTDEEFSAWCHCNEIGPETEAAIQRIRSSPPARRVRGRASNMSGRYPSVKMGCSIQFESQVEFLAIYAMERDDDVLEYYDQPTRIQLHYRSLRGHKTSPWHTPDFLVIRRNGAGFEEWKPTGALEGLTKRMPERYQPDPRGGWRCPPGEQAASALGLTYRVRTSGEYHPQYIQNLKFLQNFWTHPFSFSQQAEQKIRNALFVYPGISVDALLQAHLDLVVDVIWAMLTTQSIFTDLTATSLMDWERVFLYASASEVEAARQATGDVHPNPPIASPLIIDGRLWEVEMQDAQVLLRPEVGASFSLPVEQFHHMQAAGLIAPASFSTPSPLSEVARARIAKASPKGQEAANKRWREILAYMRGDEISVTTRSVQNWMAAYRQAEADLGCGYIGLLDRVAARGNRSPRVPDASRELLKEYLTSHYAAPVAKRAAAVYRLYRAEAEKRGIPPVGERTFYREREQFEDAKVTASRRGKRVAYALEPALAYLDQTTPRHGQRPFERAHLDHTQMDIVLVSSITGKPLAKPWVTFLTDAFSRRILACHVTYDPPSYRSVMMAFRQCVQRYGRLPQELVVDRGPEFQSVYFETLLTRCFVTKLERPAGQPRFGSVIERLFGTTNTEFLNQLRGNTQASKIPRLLTHEVDPKRLAVWTLDAFARRLAEYTQEVYDQMEHVALFQSPREAFAQGMLRAGSRTQMLIAYSEDFLIQTRPSTRTGVVKIHQGRGITVNGLQYWHECMRSPTVFGKSVPVRYEPYNMGFAYAYIDGQWIECIADAFLQVHGRSEHEWNLILEEWREHQRQHHLKRVTLNGPRLAEFLQELEKDEAWQLQRQRDLEEQPQREALLGLWSRPVEVIQEPEQAPIEVDLSTIPTYEVYH
jgi:putative transposase